ncbi:MAG: hypothetical protein QNJ43_23145 [Breoghania sp.]|nr:hypothetical protein [Breoghania sp.]
MNKKALAKRDEYREGVKSGAEEVDDYHDYNQKFSFFGFVDCVVGNVKYVMFSANGDIVAWDYFWTGAYEDPIAKEWLRMCTGVDVALDFGAYTGCYVMMVCMVNRYCNVY